MRPPQKNKKRCFQCNSKLELAIRQIGKCRCGEFSTWFIRAASQKMQRAATGQHQKSARILSFLWLHHSNPLPRVCVFRSLQITCFANCTDFLSNTTVSTTTRGRGGRRRARRWSARRNTWALRSNESTPTLDCNRLCRNSYFVWITCESCKKICVR